MKTTKKIIVAFLTVLCMAVCVGCASFDTSGYVKAVLDNSIKGESAALVEFTKSSEEEVAAVYDEQLQTNMDALLEGTSISSELEEEYRSFVIDLLKQTKYEVGESTKNKDGSYTVPVKTYALQLSVTSLIEEKTTAYVAEIQETVANGGEMPSDDELLEKTYRISLECMKEAMANATYGDAVDNTITVSIENKLYTPNQTELDNVCNNLLEVK